MSINVNIISSTMVIIIFIIFIFYKYIKGKEINLSNLILASMAGGMLPLASKCVISPFFLEKNILIEEMSMLITLTGLIMIYVCIKTIYEKILATPKIR